MLMHCEIKVAERDVDELVLLIKMIFILFNHQAPTPNTIGQLQHV